MFEPKLGVSLHTITDSLSPEVLDTEGIETVLVTRLIVDEDVAEFDLNRELVSLLRRELRP